MPSSLWESYSAFCNTDGGVILLGVKEFDDKHFEVVGVDDDTQLIKSFWDTIHNPEKISTCVLAESDVRVVSCDGKKVMVIDVPRADRKARPVHIGTNAFEGTFRRNGEGDYKCTRESVESMIRDRCDETADTCLMDELTEEDLNYETIHESYDPDRTTIELKLDDEILAQLTGPEKGAGLAKTGQKSEQSTVESRAEGRVKSRVKSRVEDGVERVSVQRIDLSDASASVKNIYKALCKDSSLTYVGLKLKLGLSTQTIAVAIATLIKRGLLRRVGPKKGGHWEILKPQS